MARSFNKVFILGNLGRDPEARSLPSGQTLTEFSVATTDAWAGKDGQRQERTTWHKVIAWGKLGEVCLANLAKGRTVFVEGRIQVREWEKDGQKRSMTEIVADTIQFLDSGGGRSGGGYGGGGGGGGRPQRGGSAPASSPADDDDPLPF